MHIHFSIFSENTVNNALIFYTDCFYTPEPMPQNMRPALTHNERLTLSAYINTLDQVYKEYGFLLSVSQTLESKRMNHLWSLINHAQFIHGSMTKIAQGLVWTN